MGTEIKLNKGIKPMIKYTIYIYPKSMKKLKRNYLKFENLTYKKCLYYVNKAKLKNEQYKTFITPITK